MDIFRLLDGTEMRLWNYGHLRSPAVLSSIHIELEEKVVRWIPYGRVAEQAQWKEKGTGC